MGRSTLTRHRRDRLALFSTQGLSVYHGSDESVHRDGQNLDRVGMGRLIKGLEEFPVALV